MKLAALGILLALAGGTEPTALPLQPRRSQVIAAWSALEPTAQPRQRTEAIARARPALAWLEPTAEPAAVRSRGEAPLSVEERARRDAVIDALLAAEARATEEPDSAERPLREALRALEEVAPLVADDARAQQARVLAQLALARTLLVKGGASEAAAALDDALRTARGQALPIALFGPAMVTLHDERLAVLRQLGPAKLEVTCSRECRVFVDERVFDRGQPELPAGAHRVWVEAVDPGLPLLRREIVLAPGEVLEIEYAVEEPAPAEPLADATEVEISRPRIMPRWAAGIGIGAGLGLATVGGGLVGVDHRCPDLSDPRQVPCPRILSTDAGGFVLIGLGSAVLLTSVAILVVDEVRARRARKNG